MAGGGMERAAFAGLAGGGIIIAAGGQRLGVGPGPDTGPNGKLEPERLHRWRGCPPGGSTAIQPQQQLPGMAAIQPA